MPLNCVSLCYYAVCSIGDAPPVSPHPASTFTLLSWNIDGLDKRDTVERAQAVCNFILSSKPHAVFLQEVVASTEIEILKKLGSLYDYYAAPNAAVKYGYFVSILVLKTEGLTVGEELASFDFPRSTMGRHVIKCSAKFYGVEIELLTSHLESMKDYALERKAQLSTVFDTMSKSSKKNLIFGGDLNLRDAEVKSVGIPPDTVDVWEACGSVQKEKFTWDVSQNDNLHWTSPNKPKCRFDRIYLLSREGGVKAKSFGLVGKGRLPGCGRFPSDHWGVWMEFSVGGSKDSTH